MEVIADRLDKTLKVAILELEESRKVQISFNVLYTELPALIYIKDQQYYKYIVEKVRLSPLFNVDEIVEFIEEKYYEAIPQVFPEDHGFVPIEESFFKQFLELAAAEIQNKGGILNILMMKDGDGEINWGAIALIYPAMILLSISIYIMFKDAKNEILEHREKTAKESKIKKKKD